MRRNYESAEAAARAWARRWGTTKESACTGGWTGLSERLCLDNTIYPTAKGWAVISRATEEERMRSGR